MDTPKVAASVLILLVIGLHAVPIVRYQGQAQTLWPFLTWAMYKNPRSASQVEARKTQIIGITAKGTKEAITPELVGLPKYMVREMYTKGMRAGDSTSARQLMRRLNARRKDPFVEVHLVIQTYKLTDRGIEIQHNPVISFRGDSTQAD